MLIYTQASAFLKCQCGHSFFLMKAFVYYKVQQLHRVLVVKIPSKYSFVTPFVTGKVVVNISATIFKGYNVETKFKTCVAFLAVAFLLLVN